MGQLLEVSLDSPTCAPAPYPPFQLPWKGLWSGPRKHLKGLYLQRTSGQLSPTPPPHTHTLDEEGPLGTGGKSA